LPERGIGRKLGELKGRGYPEVYLVLGLRVAKDRRVWAKLAGPTRPNGTTGWVLRKALGKLQTDDTYILWLARHTPVGTPVAIVD
jgi:hypothetical protein